MELLRFRGTLIAGRLAPGTISRGEIVPRESVIPELDALSHAIRGSVAGGLSEDQRYDRGSPFRARAPHPS
jgi:hypothetical protein